jgi:hypothetical protein
MYRDEQDGRGDLQNIRYGEIKVRTKKSPTNLYRTCDRLGCGSYFDITAKENGKEKCKKTTREFAKK